MFKRKYIALVLVCTILFCLLPGTAAAAEIQEETVMESTQTGETEAIENTVYQEEANTETKTITETEIETETEIQEDTSTETETYSRAESEVNTEDDLEINPASDSIIDSDNKWKTRVEIEAKIEAMSLEERENFMGRMGFSMNSAAKEETSVLTLATAASSSYKNTRFNSITRLCVVDISQFQENVDFNTLKTTGVQGVILRVGGRGYTSGGIYYDDSFPTYIKQAKKAGLKVGVYFFSQAISNSEAVKEAKVTIDTVKASGYKMDLPVFIDYEWSWDGETRWRTDNNASKSVRTSIIRSFCETIEDAGYETGIYASASWFTTYIDGNALSKEYNIWVAQWLVNNKGEELVISFSPNNNYTYPGNYYTGVLDGWQYCSKGIIKGRLDYFDLDYWYIPAGSITFKDVYSSSLYYYEPVYWASNAGITNGYFNKSWFKPKDTCTREQMVTFLWRMKGSPEPSLTKSPFSDVTSGKYYYKAVLWAYEKGITKGYSNRTFGVGKVCLREQAMTFLWRAAGSPEPTSNNTFSDIKNNTYYYNAVLWGCENGITKGYSDGTFGPSKNCLREHVITFLYRYHNL